MNKTTVAQEAKTASFLSPVQGLLQRKCACGNHTTAGGECAECAKNKAGLQRKLSIGASNDPLEQEADRVADQVMAAPANSAVSSAPLRIQRYSGQVSEGVGTAPASVDRVLASSGRPLEPALRNDMEQRFGHDFSRVRVHTGGAAEQSARDVNAHAYTVGNDVVFGARQFTTESHEGQRLIAHELTHVVQQTGVDQGGRSLMQRKKAPPTDFGEFETTKFVEADGRGVEIILKFTPDESKVDAKKIALSQSIKKTNASGTAYAIDPNQASKMVATGNAGAGYVIDQLSSVNNPIYSQDANLGASKELKDTPTSANTTAAATAVGVNTNYELGYCYKEKPTDAAKKKHPASLWDKPQGGKNKGESKMFETTAFAIEGADKDKYYGSVTWGYKMEGTDAAPTVTKIDIDRASKGTPTANFIEPAKLWNVGKTQGTLKVTSDPEATVLKGDNSGTEKLAKDKKLKQLGTVMWGTDPAINAEVLKADGTGSGKIVYIKNSDVKDMGDGSANKVLPIVDVNLLKGYWSGQSTKTFAEVLLMNLNAPSAGAITGTFSVGGRTPLANIQGLINNIGNGLRIDFTWTLGAETGKGFLNSMDGIHLIGGWGQGVSNSDKGTWDIKHT